MSSKGKRLSAASTYSSSKKRRDRNLSPSSESQSDAKASPPRAKSKNASGKSKTKANGSKSSKKAPPSSGEEEEEEEDEDEKEYEVDTIKEHCMKRGVLHYYVGWKGYGSSDDEWLPESRINADELVKQYRVASKLDPISKSGRASDASAKSKKSAKGSDQSDDDEDDKKTRKRKRLSQGKASSSIAPLRKNGTGGPTKADRNSVKNRKPVRSEAEVSDAESVDDEEWHKKHKNLSSWEKLIRSVRTIEKPAADGDDASQNSRGKVEDTINVCLLWECGRVSWVSNKIARDKLPQKMLDFYEAHLQFSPTDA